MNKPKPSPLIMRQHSGEPIPKIIFFLPKTLCRKTSPETRVRIRKELKKIIRALRLSRLASQHNQETPEWKKAQAIRGALKSVEKNLADAARLIADGHIFAGIVGRYGNRPGDRETAETFASNLERILVILHRAINEKPKLFFTRAEIPAMVAADVKELLIANGLRPTLTPSGVWAKLTGEALRQGGYEVKSETVKNAMRSGVKIRKK